jgi:RimJ/RimL family protein N-acetyltransferase
MVIVRAVTSLSRAEALGVQPGSRPEEQHKSIIETERLRLRKLRQSDFAELYAMFNDPLVMKHYPRMRDEKGTQEWIDLVLEDYAQRGHSFWAVERKSTGEFVGQCGLLLQNVDGVAEIEVGYLFKSAHWHRGYATEAARAVRDYAFTTLGCKSVISLIRPANLPSCRVAERNGMSIEKTTMFHGFEALVYRICPKR